MTTPLPGARSESEKAMKEVKGFVQHGEQQVDKQCLFCHSLHENSSRSQDNNFCATGRERRSCVKERVCEHL